MKKTFKNYTIILFSLLLFTCLSSLLLAILDKNAIINSSTSKIIAIIFSYISIAIFSFILGLKMNNKGIFHGILLSLILIGISALFGNNLSNTSYIIKIITKSIIAIFFTVLGVNKKNS